MTCLQSIYFTKLTSFLDVIHVPAVLGIGGTDGNGSSCGWISSVNFLAVNLSNVKPIPGGIFPKTLLNYKYLSEPRNTPVFLGKPPDYQS